jgi:hypothetical protein
VIDWEMIEGVIVEKSNSGRITYTPDDGGYLAILEDHNWGSTTSMWDNDFDRLRRDAHDWFTED